MQGRRPCDGDHTQHPSGTAEQDTLRTWFSVNAIVSVRRKVMEQQGEKVQRLELLKNVSLARLSCCNAQAAETCFGVVA